MLVDDMEDMRFLLLHFVHPLQKGASDVQGVTFLPFGTAVKDKYFHWSTFLLQR
jgi:hypothetical protein